MYNYLESLLGVTKQLGTTFTCPYFCINKPTRIFHIYSTIITKRI